MAPLLALIFAVEVAVAVVNSVGAAAFNNLMWKLYTWTPIGSSKQLREERELQTSFLRVRRDLNATSSQDEFAKWARLRRQHDKMLEELEKTKANIDASKASFDMILSTIRWLSTSGARWLIPFWFSREPTFWLPHGWFPYFAEWLISLPRAPLGSVSVVSWQLACTEAIALVMDALVIIRQRLELRQGNTSGQKKRTVTSDGAVTAEKTRGSQKRPESTQRKTKKEL